MLTRLPPRRLLKGLHRRGLGSRINLGELLEGVRLFVRRTAVSFVYWPSSSEQMRIGRRIPKAQNPHRAERALVAFGANLSLKSALPRLWYLK